MYLSSTGRWEQSATTEMGSSIPLLSGIGQQPAANATIRHFNCTDADRTAIENILRVSIPPNSFQDAVATAAANAMDWARRAAYPLERSRRTGATYDRARQLFEEAFGAHPGTVPNWRPAGQTWDRGIIVRIRLLRAARILERGSIRYYCWGPRHRPAWEWTPRTRARVVPGRYEIYFGEGFWRDWVNLERVSNAATLLHEALHIYFNTVAHGERGRYGSANCFVRYALNFNNQPLPRRVTSATNPSACR